jgi:hypothetical protein
VKFEFWLDDDRPSELDAYLTRIDLELDALFMDEVGETVERLDAERAARSDTAAA